MRSSWSHFDEFVGDHEVRICYPHCEVCSGVIPWLILLGWVVLSWDLIGRALTTWPRTGHDVWCDLGILGLIRKLDYIGLFLVLLVWDSDFEPSKEMGKMDIYPECWRIGLGFQLWVADQLLIGYYFMMLSHGFFGLAVRDFIWVIY